jgi:hypothetical protein
MTTTMATSYRDAAITLWGEAGAYAHDAYQRLQPLFPGLPDELPIVIGLTAYGHCVGLTRADWEHGPRITIASGEFKPTWNATWQVWRPGGTRLVDDTMVHEMTHAWLHLTGQKVKHDSEAWYAAIRRLSPAVLGHEIDVHRGADRRSVRVKLADGTSVVRKERVPGFEGLKAKVAGWPGTFRPADYDVGDPIDCPTY